MTSKALAGMLAKTVSKKTNSRGQKEEVYPILSELAKRLGLMVVDLDKSMPSEQNLEILPPSQ